MNRIEESLQKLFESERLIFWYDEKMELTEEYEALEFSDIEKIHVKGNEFQVKHTVTKANPAGKFLLYFSEPKPSNESNWLLDLEISNYLFHTDQEAMFLQDLGLEYHFKELVGQHIAFFESKERRSKLKDLLGEGDAHREIRFKMLAVVFVTENISLESFLQSHSSAYNDGNERFEKDLGRYDLDEFYWTEIAAKYNYHSEKPSIYEFLLEVFGQFFALGTSRGIKRDARILLSLWKDSIGFQDSFRNVSSRIASDLKIEASLNEATLDMILKDDLFELVDKRVISELVSLLVQDSISDDRLDQVIKQRENKFWFPNFEHFYATLRHAGDLIFLVKKFVNVCPKSLTEGIGLYAKQLYKVDFAYRKFIWHFRKTSQNSGLKPLAEKIEKVYSNDWLLPFNDQWQGVIDALGTWPNQLPNAQRNFFDKHVQPILSREQRVFVILSDAFRYESGKEFAQSIQGENRYDATLNAAFASLPSYTQLGMASLLPHTKLAIQPDSDNVLVDEIPSVGIQGRTKILAANSGVRATAIKAEEFMSLNANTSGRAFVKEYDLIYIYHNQIDKVGDDKTSEDKVFEAVERELNFLTELVKKIANMNGTHMFITADHGYIYQHNPLEESDFTAARVSGEIWKESRRYILGKGLEGDNSTRHFSGGQLGLEGEVEALIPKSINRLRVRGAGSRFIHGGASLQEIVIPVIYVNKRRKDTTSQVEVDIIKTTDRITTNILAVSFLQSNLVDEKTLPRNIRAAIFAEDGELLSDQFNYLFDISEGSERQREVKHRFQLSSKASGKYKNQRVKLVLQEPVESTSKWKQYKEYYYTLNISFTNDFDDW